MKRFIGVFTAFVICFGMVGCSAKTDGGKSKKSSGSVAITLSDLDISIEEEINDGSRRVMFWFTNNSDYTITYCNLRLRPKSGLTKEDFQKFKDFDMHYPDDWDVEYIFLDAEYGDEYAYADDDTEDLILVKSGETSEKEEVHRNNIMYVSDIEIYNMMDPDILTIQYLDKDEVEHKINYDYKSKKYNEEEID